jgi:hypothetical protein
MAQFIWMRVALPSAHVRQYFVFVLKTLPLGTSGVWVEIVTETAFSRSRVSRVSVEIHFVCFGAKEEPLRGLM